MTWWECAVYLFLFIVAVSFIAAFIEEARRQSRREKEWEAARKWQSKQ